MSNSRRIVAAAMLAVSVTASAVIPAFAKVNEYEGQHKINEYEGQHKVNEYEGQHGFVVAEPSEWAAVKASPRLF